MATGPHPDDVTCPTCNGTGFESAARKMGMEDMPQKMTPIGVWHCTSCNGSGKLIDGAKMTEVLKVLEAYIDEDPELIADSFLANKALKK